MKIIIKAQSSIRAKNGDGRLRVSINGEYREIRAVVFSKSQKNILMKAADNAQLIKAKSATEQQCRTTKHINVINN